jgi:hypothetical protein
MLGQDPTRQFDYLFEPLIGVGADETTDDADPPIVVQSDGESRRSAAAPNRFVLAAIVLAATAAAAATVILLLHPQETAGQVDAPADPVPVATTESQLPSQPVLVVPPTETAPVNEPPDVTATVEPQPAQPDPTTGGGPDLQGRPSTRAPISVQPEPRQLFPNQSPRGDGGQSPAAPSGLPGSPSQSDSHGHGPHR